MDAQAYRQKIEEEILKLISEKLQAGQMNTQRAKEIANFVLESLKPHMTVDQIHLSVLKFDDHFPELVPAIIPIIRQYDDKVRQTVLAHVEKLIEQKKIDEAVGALNKALSSSNNAKS